MLQIFQYDFMLRAFAAGILIAIIAPIIGIFLVLRRYSLFADTLSHVSLVGVALGVLLNFNPLIGALIASTVTAIGMERLRSSRKLFGESILALFLSGSLAIAVVLLGLAHSINVNIFSYLFGSITTVTTHDLWIIAGFGLLVVITAIILFKKLFLVSYDEELAEANGLPTTWLKLILMILAAITISLSMTVVGSLLVGALMVIPVLTAVQYGKSFSMTAMLSVLISLVCVITGLFASFYLNLPSGGTIVVTTVIVFGLSALGKKA